MYSYEHSVDLLFKYTAVLLYVGCTKDILHGNHENTVVWRWIELRTLTVILLKS
jgi:hypothetical protein